MNSDDSFDVKNLFGNFNHTESIKVAEKFINGRITEEEFKKLNLEHLNKLLYG